MRKEQQIQRVSRIIDVNSHTLTIEEHTELENEAGAVVWDAALVLLNYFCTGRQLSDLACGLTSQSSQLLLRSVLSDYSYLRFYRLCFADPGVLQGKRCIELGAGTGVVGLTAALLGALVVLTGNGAFGG